MTTYILALVDRVACYCTRLCAPDFPCNACDADFFASLFIIVKPLSFGEIDTSELAAGVGSRC